MRNKNWILIRWWMVLFICSSIQGFSQDSTYITSDTLICGDASIIFNEQCVEILPGVSIVHVHENETTAVEAANWLLDSVQSGCFVTWQCQQQRFVHFTMQNQQYTFDPNRIYTAAGRKATIKSISANLSKSATAAVKMIADTFLKKYINSQQLVVALHNNTNAGGLTVASYKRGGVYAGDATAVFANSKEDPDDFFYTTEPAFFNFLKYKGYNVVLQHNAGVKDDGSLSVYCAGNKVPYINIEAQDGHLQQQKEMLALVWEIIKNLPQPEYFENQKPNFRY